MKAKKKFKVQLMVKEEIQKYEHKITTEIEENKSRGKKAGKT